MFPFLGQPCDLGPRLLQVLFQRLLPAEGAGAGTGSHSHPVLRHPLQGNGPGSHQRGRDLCQQLIQGPLVGHPKVRQHVVVDGHPSTQPPVSIVFLAQARQLPGTAYPFHSAEQPQGQQHFRVRCGAARPVQRRFDGAVEGRQVQLFQQAPDSPGRVVFSQRCIQVPGQKLELLPVWLEHASLLGTGRRRRYPLLGWRQFEQRRFSHSSPPKHLFPLLSLIPTRRARPWGCIYSHALRVTLAMGLRKASTYSVNLVLDSSACRDTWVLPTRPPSICWVCEGCLPPSALLRTGPRAPRGKGALPPYRSPVGPERQFGARLVTCA